VAVDPRKSELASSTEGFRMPWGTGIEVFGRADRILAAPFLCVVCKGGSKRWGRRKLPSDSGPSRVLRWNVWVTEMNLIHRIDAPRHLGHSAFGERNGFDWPN
jgi:hypothetical protein